ncbi:hypothetical protein [Aurantiacibacter poecillastricola]|uniref:hypothetical protein n=1 Tax=Aurantiacibacter poecillastricola TaxID=3064385 RepID=UPI00273DB860|nr:hypothetical protein [Aurantiacibacter sp. 219JJ12-13]MDP5262198.1 hypothetical protein [Aurantiacibacter sp. 219JJ12-13]
MRIGLMGVAFCALSLAACGGDDGPTGAPVVWVTPTPTASPTLAPLPPRPVDYTYSPGFSPDINRLFSSASTSSEDRALEGYILTVLNSPTGSPSTPTDSDVSIDEDPFRGGPGPTGSFSYEVADAGMVLIDLGNNAGLFSGNASTLQFVQEATSLTWTGQRSIGGPDATLTWAQPDEFAGNVPQYYSQVSFAFTQATAGGADDSVTRSFIGGSHTFIDDVPASGQERVMAKLSLNSDEPGDGSYALSGTGTLLIDYSARSVSGTIALEPVGNSLATPTSLEISADIEFEAVQEFQRIRGDVTGSAGNGRIVGQFFGPYAVESAGNLTFTSTDGQAFYGTFETRRE